MRREEKNVIIDNLTTDLNATKHFYLTDTSELCLIPISLRKSMVLNLLQHAPNQIASIAASS
mgnify:CR=1 FL=1